MNRLHAALILILCLLSCKPDAKTACARFHSGTFIMHEAWNQRIILTRNDSVQLEFNDKTGHAFKSRIKWHNDCEYVLTDFYERLDSADTFRQ